MANKQVLSVVAASILAAAFTFTGCGTEDDNNNDSSSSVSSSVSSSISSTSSSVPESSSSVPVSSSSVPVSSSSVPVSSSSEPESSSSVPVSSSSAPADMTSVKVSDAYVIEADVTIGATQLIVTDVAGVYETVGIVTGPITVKNGVNDLDGNGVVTIGVDAYTPTLRAPQGYTNVNPYTTLMVLGMEKMSEDFPVAFALKNNFDLDVVAGASLDLQREVLIAAQTIKRTIDSAIGNAPVRGSLPDPGEGSSSSSSDTSSSEVGSSSSNGSLPDPDGDNIVRLSATEIAAINAMSADELTVSFQTTFGTVTDSSSSSSSDGSLPDPGEGSSSSNVSSSSEAGSSSSNGSLPNPGETGNGSLPNPGN